MTSNDAMNRRCSECLDINEAARVQLPALEAAHDYRTGKGRLPSPDIGGKAWHWIQFLLVASRVNCLVYSKYVAWRLQLVIEPESCYRVNAQEAWSKHILKKQLRHLLGSAPAGEAIHCKANRMLDFETLWRKCKLVQTKGCVLLTASPLVQVQA